MGTLFFSPKAGDGEAPLSLLRRTAAGNGLRSTLQFLHGFTRAVDHSESRLGVLARAPQLFRSVARAAHVPDAEIEKVVYGRVGNAREDDLLWQGLRVGVSALCFRRAKTCVACLVEDGYAHQEWDHRAAVACARHAVLLETACPICHSPWTWDSDPLSCGCDVKAMRKRSVAVPAPTASLLHRIVAARDQVALNILDAAHGVLAWWERLGITWSSIARALALERLFSGAWPALADEVRKPAHEQLHARLALAPLLTSPLPEVQSLAQKLLLQQAPPLHALLPATLTLPASEAMAILGVRRVPLAKLVRDNHLECANASVSVHSINRLLLLTSAGNAPVGNTQSLAQLRVGSSRLSLSAALKGIQDGRLALFDCPASTGLSGLRVVLPAKDSTASAPSALGLAEVAHQCGVHPECVRALARVGRLGARKGGPRGATQWTFDTAEVDRFVADFVFASVLAKAQVCALTTFASRLRSAGIEAVSGPGIDGGLTYLFRREDVVGLDLQQIAAGDYRSPAGRKPASTRTESVDVPWSTAAEMLGVSNRAMRKVVAEGWLQPGVASGRRFPAAAVESLRDCLRQDYLALPVAAEELGQSELQFRRAWVGTGELRTFSFADRQLVRIADFVRIRDLWKTHCTGTEIGRRLGRHRSVCGNLEKIGTLGPARVMGAGSRKVKLYDRGAPILERYQLQISG